MKNFLRSIFITLGLMGFIYGILAASGFAYSLHGWRGVVAIILITLIVGWLGYHDIKNDIENEGKGIAPNQCHNMNKVPEELRGVFKDK